LETRSLPHARPAATTNSIGRRVLIVASAIHVTNDACFALLFPLLPLIANDFHLSYTQVGLLRTAFTTAQSLFQIPAGALGGRWGEGLVLLVGNAWVGIGLVAMALAGLYGLLLIAAIGAGLGGNAQHPLATAMVSRVFPKERRSTALGTLNFSGDLGKLVGPLIVGVIAARGGWRAALFVAGGFTAIFSLALLARHTALLPDTTTSECTEKETQEPDGTRPGFALLLAVGILDSATRGAALTFLPFVVARHGADPAAVSALFGLIFAAGAAGKFLCGWLGDRLGLLAVIATTELATAATLVGFVALPAITFIPLAVVFGFGLNGTSSVLLSAVAHFTPAQARARGYGIYFTATLASAALAPLVYGLLGDAAGLVPTFLVMAAATAAVLLPVLPIHQELRAVAA
jgi:FSR family fosmidomycin resistance protein-like MFS transporter